MFDCDEGTGDNKESIVFKTGNSIGNVVYKRFRFMVHELVLLSSTITPDETIKVGIYLLLSSLL